MRQLLIIILVVLAYLFIKRWLRNTLAGGNDAGVKRPGTHNDTHRNSPANAEDMVQDPNCGTFVPVSRALTYRHEGRTLHFCSEDCANEYARKLKSGEI